MFANNAWAPLEVPALAPSARSVVQSDGSASLLHFTGSGERARPPVLIVPSLINRWFVVDLRAGASLVEGLLARGLDVYCLDWGVPGDEDRYLTWDAVVARLQRAIRRTLRHAGSPALSLLGYCMGSTVAGICAALEPDPIHAFVNLLGPFDFSRAGPLAHAVDRRWFDVDAMVDAGNISGPQMQSGFVALRPTLQVGKWVSFADRAHDPAARRSFAALEAWAQDNVPFPAEAYRTYIGELYQQNALARGEHRVAGRAVDLGAIRCPILTVVAERDDICPPAAARGLNRLAGSQDSEVLSVPGGHVGAVVGGGAAEQLYPAIAGWLMARSSGPSPAPVKKGP